MNYLKQFALLQNGKTCTSKLIYALLLLSILFSFNAYAQDAPCQDCIPISTNKRITKVLCSALVSLPGNSSPTPLPDAIWIDIDYIETKCDDRIVIELRSFTTHTPIYNWDDLGWPYTMTCDSITPNPHPHPYDLNDWGAWNLWMHKITEALLPPSVGPRIIRFPAGCKALARIKWPDDAVYFGIPYEGGTMQALPLGETVRLVDCGGACCEVEMHKDDNTLQIKTIKPVFDCGDPDPVNTTLTVKNPTTGEQITYTGTVVKLTACNPMCLEEYPTGMFTGVKTDRLAQEENLILVKPTVFSDFVSIESNHKIQKVLLTDTRGVKLYEGRLTSNKLTLPNLNQGLYILHVYLESGNMKTFKIIKE